MPARPMFAAALALTLPASADVATFDARTEGFPGNTLTEAGITFSNMSRRIDGDPVPGIFAIEQADGFLADQPGFTPNNCLGFGGYAPGDQPAFSRLGEFTMTVAEPATSASIHVWDFSSNDPGTVIILDAYSGSTLVNTVSVPVLAPFGLHHYEVALDGPAFDRLHLHIGPTDQDVIFALVDTVTIESASCAADCTGDGGLSVADFACFRNLYLAGDMAADCDESGSLEVSDFTCFRASYLAGCP